MKHGSEGGRARAAKLSPGRRREIAQKAAAARWARRNKKPQLWKRKVSEDGLLYCYGCKRDLPLRHFNLHTRVLQPDTVTATNWDVNCQKCARVKQAYYLLKKLAKTAGMDAVVKEMRRAEDALETKKQAYARLLAEAPASKKKEGC